MAGNWWEVHVFADPALDDLIFWRMEQFGCQGTASELKGNLRVVRSYLPESQFKVLDLAALSLLLRQDALCVNFPAPIVQWKLMDEEDWASSWKQYWHPQEVGDRFLIYPAWLPLPDRTDRLVLRLDPGVAFGTGTHATTQLCLEALEMRLGLVLTADGISYQQGPSSTIIADIGCGSGILAIGAILLGAHRVYAVDLDPLAVSSTESNRLLNRIDPQRLQVQQGSLDRLLKMTDEPVDGFVCNILAEVIIELIPHFLAIAKAETWGILSGILLEQASAVAAVLEQNGWVVATLWKRGEWCCFTIRRF